LTAPYWLASKVISANAEGANAATRLAVAGMG
jgi:hypothetical protein